MSSGISITPRGGAFTGRGGWNAATQYYQDDFVVWQGVEYQSLLPVNRGNQPDLSPAAWIVTPGGSGAISPVTGRAYRNAAFTFASAAWTKVPIDTSTFDTGGMVSIGSGRINILQSGYYQVNAQLSFNATATGRYLVGIYKNGSEIAESGPQIPSGFQEPAISDVISC